MFVKKLSQFINDTSGIIFEGVIAVSFIIMSSMVWLCGEVIVSRVFDGFLPILNLCDPRGLAMVQMYLNAYGVSIVIVDVLFIVWWGLAAGKSESQESPLGVRF